MKEKRKEALIKYLNSNSLNKIYRNLCVFYKKQQNNLYDMYIIFDDDSDGNITQYEYDHYCSYLYRIEKLKKYFYERYNNYLSLKKYDNYTYKQYIDENLEYIADFILKHDKYYNTFKHIFLKTN